MVIAYVREFDVYYIYAVLVQALDGSIPIYQILRNLTGTHLSLFNCSVAPAKVPLYWFG